MRTLDLIPNAAAAEGGRAGLRDLQVLSPDTLPLSAAAARVRDRLGIPITALPGVEAERPGVLPRRSRVLNRLINGDTAASGIWEILGRHLGPSGFERLREHGPPALPRLWEHGELSAVEGEGLVGVAREWRRRLARHPVWSRAVRALQPDRDYAAIWRDILGGDFDLSGRGVEYTEGMAIFQASRWLGAQTLLTLLGARHGGGLFLDVLGGDGYVWRILQAERRLAESSLVIVHHGGWSSDGVGQVRLTRELEAALAEIHATYPAAAVLVVCERSGDHHAVLLQEDGAPGFARLMILSGEDLGRLAQSPGVALHPVGGACRASSPEGEPLIITNDVSPHMFARAGMWGLPTREDATCLSRTFCPGSFNGVLFAYGTHHITDMPAAVHEAHRVLKPGGTVVVHDFFDEGPAGEWFHRVVHERSKTGHPFPHIGPVQMAVLLLRTGFQDVRLYEIQDPFLFACEEGERSARDLALQYICGMYGLAPGFPDGLDELEATIRQVLTYPEIAEVPVFTDDFVYIPRRAVVAVATRPAGEPVHTEGDLALIRTISALFERTEREIAAEVDLPEDVYPYWFPSNGQWWGTTPAEQADWLALMATDREVAMEGT